MSVPDFLPGGVMSARVRSHDWSGSPLGPTETWPPTLRTALSITLSAGFPTYLAWGPGLISFHNDAFLPILRNKPAALGRQMQDVWAEIWADIGPLAARALAGVTSYFEDWPLTVHRQGDPEEAWFTFSYSPIHDDTGGVVGVFCTVLETTQAVLAARRLQLINELRNRLRRVDGADDLIAITAETLGRHLGVGRVGYGETDEAGQVLDVKRDWTDGVMKSVAGRHHLDDFGPQIINELRAGRTLRLDDAATDPRTTGKAAAAAFASAGLRSSLSAPFMQDGHFVALLYVHHPEPRRWRADEVSLVEEIAQRTWEAIRRVRAEKALRENEAFLSTILQQLPIGVGVFDRTGHQTLGNQALHRFPIDQMPSHADPSRQIWRGFRPDGSPIPIEEYPGARALRGQATIPGIEFLQTRLAGNEIWTRVSAVPLRGADGTLTGAVVTVEDIDQEKRANAALRESEERFRQFAANSTDVLWTVDCATHQVDYVSPAYERVWGRAATPGLHDLGDWIASLHAEDRSTTVAAQDRVMFDGRVMVQEYRIVRPDGAVRWIKDTVFPIRDEKGNVRRIGGIAQDITRHDGTFVYLVDAAQGVHDGLAPMLLGAGYEVKTFPTVSGFLENAPALVPGCVLLDLRAPAAQAMLLLRELKGRRLELPVVVVGETRGDVALAVQSMKSGAVEYLEAPCSPERLHSAVASALADIRASVARDRDADLAMACIATLSARERDVLEGLLAGGTNKTIARDLGLSPRTVEVHRAHVMDRLGARTLPDLVLKASSAGLRGSHYPPTKA